MQSFYFYDLETSGFNPRDARIMQFAGQRTDMQLRPIGESHNLFIKLSDDVVPEPDAVLVTGITPQKTIAEGITEAEFLKHFHSEIAVPDTIFVGYNSVRFDDEFMRYLHYRNFYDAYEWQWQDGQGRWDLLDVVRMMRALRPEGIKWPVDSEGKATNRLELLTSMNGVEHNNAHDAMNDVNATIGLANIIRAKQPKLFDFLFRMKDKKEVIKLVQSGKPFLYTSGKYSSDWEKTTAVVVLAQTPDKGFLVYDLRFDPTEFAAMSVEQLAEAWKWRRDDPTPQLPVKTLKPNRCPAVAPLSVLDEESKKRIKLDHATIESNHRKLLSSQLADNVLKALSLLEKARQASFIIDESDVDARLYDGFVGDADKTLQRAIRAAEPENVDEFKDKLQDDRLRALLPLYKARNFFKSLDSEEMVAWELFRKRKLLGGKQESRLAKYFARLGELAEKPGLTTEQKYLLEELQLYGQSIMPEDLDA